MLARRVSAVSCALVLTLAAGRLDGAETRLLPAPEANSPRSPVRDSDRFSRGLQRRVADATVRLLQEDRGGTATLIGKDEKGGWLLTAYHCVSGKRPVCLFLFDYGDERRSGGALLVTDRLEVVATLPDADLALLRWHTNRPLPEPVRVCPTGVEPVAPFAAFTIGCNGSFPSIQLTDVPETCRSPGLGGRPWLIADRVAHGRSGGALVDERGYLVGVCCCFGPDNRGVYQSCGQIHRLLDAAGRDDLYGGRQASSLEGWEVVQIVARLLAAWLLASWLERRLGPPRVGPGNGLALLLLPFPFALFLLHQWLPAGLSWRQSVAAVAALTVAQVAVLGWACRACGSPSAGAFCVLPALGPAFALAFGTSPVVTAAVGLGYYVPLAARVWIGPVRPPPAAPPVASLQPGITP